MVLKLVFVIHTPERGCQLIVRKRDLKSPLFLNLYGHSLSTSSVIYQIVC